MRSLTGKFKAQESEAALWPSIVLATSLMVTQIVGILDWMATR